MFNDDELAQLKLQYDAYTASAKPQQEKPKEEKKKPGGARGFLLNALPIIGGAVGAVGGTLVAPVAGTAAGGAVGSGLGEFLRQKLSGEAENGVDRGNIIQESAFGALPGIGKAVSAVRSAKAAKAAAETTEGAMQARKGMIAKTQGAAQQANMEGRGIQVGASAGRGRVTTPEMADQLNDFMVNRAQQYGGIRSGKPIDQARDAQNVFNNVTKSLDETLAKIDRPLTAGEPQTVVASALTKIGDNAAVTGTTKTMGKFQSKLENAKSLKDLETIRREADDLAFTSTGAGKTSAAAQAHAVRDAIDEFITPLSPDYKAIKSDYTLARDALEATSKANKSAKGFKLPFMDMEIGKQTVPGVKNKVSAMVSGTAQPQQAAGFQPFRQVARAAVPQVGYRAAGTALLGTPFVNSETQPEQPELTQEPALAPLAPPQMESGTTQTSSSGSIFSNPEAVQQAYLQLLSAGNTEAANALIKGYELFGQTAAEKPLSAEASKVIATSNSGLQSLAQLEQMIEEGGVPTGTTIPGRGLFGGAGQSLLGTSAFDAAADNVADAMVRARTGAAATKEELALYRRLLPQAFDPPEVRQQKMQTVRDYFSSISNRTGSAGTDMQQMVGM